MLVTLALLLVVFCFCHYWVDVLHFVSAVLICDEMEILGRIIEKNLEHTSHSPILQPSLSIDVFFYFSF